MVINKITSDNVVDFAAEELRKYLFMMMPDSTDITISYNPTATDGFRLGLMQDFGLDVSDAEDTVLDDILYIDTDKNGGIIAGDNPRSVLLSVYEYFRQNGCRWLFPGPDGEYIPLKDIEPVKYRHKPSMRYRGQCNEGAEFQSGMIDAIEFTPKIGLNVFMMEFFTPVAYYRNFYTHVGNETNRPPEPVSDATMLQWKRQCEAELLKRGLQFHDIGHGWCAEPFGIDSGVIPTTDEEKAEVNASIPDEQRKYLALVKGKREFWTGVPLFSQFCMSNPEARHKVASYVARYAEKHPNSDYLHVWLGDGRNNHCECEECKKKIPSDWYVMLLNEIDEELTKKNLDTRIVYIAYTETLWAPEHEKLNNPKRFSLLFAPISREYSRSISLKEFPVKITPYVRNKTTPPTTFEELFTLLSGWTKNWNGSNIAYEYHFWRHMVYDLGGISLAKVVANDVKFYEKHNIHGIIQDGSQRAFFPTGLAYYAYARTLFDTSLSFEEICEDYMSVAFGEDWRLFYDYLEKLGNTFSHEFTSCEKNKRLGRCDWYDPEKIADLDSVRDITRAGRELIKSHYNSEYRIRTASVRLLEFHANHADMMADFFKFKALGDDVGAREQLEKMKLELGRYEAYFERTYDHCMHYYFLEVIANKRTDMNDGLNQS